MSFAEDMFSSVLKDTQMFKYVLEMKNITKKFPGTMALDNVDLQILPGEVHALVGENGAGKSTLMKIATGIYQPTSGEILFEGNKLTSLTPVKALETGISMIAQELNPIREMTVAENIFLHREPMKYRILTDVTKQEEMTRELLAKFKMNFKPSLPMKSLTIAQQQMIEIVKAVSYNSQVVIMDEPTSSLDSGETRELFNTINNLKNNGISIIYISHRLEEINEICDRLTVFRDGKYIDTREVKKTSRDEIIQMMVGRSIKKKNYTKNTIMGKEILSVHNFTRKGFFKNISFNVHEGEVLGFSGLVGAGRSETMKSLFGLDPYDSGKVMMYGKEIRIRNTRDAISRGIAMVTEDRREYGLVLCRSILENTSLSSLRMSQRSIVNRKRERKEVNRRVAELSVKAPHLGINVENLSGGNQQKVILAKWLMASPKLLILDEPTRGIDIGAKEDIYNLIVKFRENGMAIILISSELPEIMSLSNRIIVLHEGEMTGEFTREEIAAGNVTQEDVLNKSFGDK